MRKRKWVLVFVFQDGTSNPDVVLLRTTVLGEFPLFLFVEESFICCEDPLLVLLQGVLLNSCGKSFQDDGGWALLGGWALPGRVARWFLVGNATSHMKLHFHVLESLKKVLLKPLSSCSLAQLLTTCWKEASQPSMVS